MMPGSLVILRMSLRERRTSEKPLSPPAVAGDSVAFAVSTLRVISFPFMSRVALSLATFRRVIPFTDSPSLKTRVSSSAFRRAMFRVPIETPRSSTFCVADLPSLRTGGVVWGNTREKASFTTVISGSLGSTRGTGTTPDTDLTLR